ncbi:SAG-related sequence [Besnoitia besnoiti]|uniref:SAG-related sequence n=1 Tax=Besnoitia besnoiti TaxID=94643 RepID=A0A2A9MLZ5_BESBE|nr:SAG-related sequence [Besnoitia besnoiti]PFH37381.1 SAG-related sequence [Besnoitia besnoiti]
MGGTVRMLGLTTVVAVLCVLPVNGDEAVSGGTVVVHDVTPTSCKDGKLELPLPAKQEKLVFKCGDSLSHLNPSDAGYVYQGETASKESKKLMSEVISGASLQSKTPAENQNTLAVPSDRRPDQGVKVTFICQKDPVQGDPIKPSENTCTVTVNIEGKKQPEKEEEKPSGEEGKADTPSPAETHTCSAGKVEEISVSKATTEVKMKCPHGLTFKPVEACHAYAANCQDSVPLKSLLTGAERKDAGDIHTLSVSILPEGSESKVLCYRCDAGDAGAGKTKEQECQFRITVKGADSVDSGVDLVAVRTGVSLSMVGAFVAVVSEMVSE